MPQAVGAVCRFLPLAIWAYGPTEYIQFQLSPSAALIPDGPMPVYTEAGTWAGTCERAETAADGEL